MNQDLLEMPIRSPRLEALRESNGILWLALGVSLGFGLAATAWAAGIRPLPALRHAKFVVPPSAEEPLRDAVRAEPRPALPMAEVEDSTRFVAPPAWDRAPEHSQALGPDHDQGRSYMSKGVLAKYQAFVGSHAGPAETNDFNTR